MGALKCMTINLLWICIFLMAITFLPGLPPHIEFTSYTFELPNYPHLSPVSNLSKAEKIFKGKIVGPESFDAYDEILYISMYGGTVSRLIDNNLEQLVKFGKSCDQSWEEDICGRPLGLKFDINGNLYVVDTYYGIFKVNITTKSYEKIVDITIPIDGKVPMTPNSIDVSKNGDLYWTDSSSDYKLYDGIFSMLSNPSGRLIHFSAKTKKNTVLLENLGFANGIKLSDDESFIFVAETLTSRIIKYHLKGLKAGKSEIIIEGLPGLPDNIHSDNHGNFFVSLIVTADEENPQLLQSLSPHPYIRKLFIRLLTLLELPFKFFYKIYPDNCFKKVYLWIGHFQSFSFLIPRSAIVLRINEHGKILDILESRSGDISDISSAFILNDYLWLGSPFNDYLGRISMNQILPTLEKQNIKFDEKILLDNNTKKNKSIND
ncbi:hypothetical protein G9C98_003655 [Cotesia typhae]|uniref:Strictosidine synthase conserved region domain-containing protein n=2 Tax=Cotesia typhae TaxID=2053667 RepID=A0A8J5UQQ6_9HYME|nr:hypothetical protein G9C98_003655 [Cotesia typhae]